MGSIPEMNLFKNIFSWVHPGLVVRLSGEKGRAVFASTSICKDERIAVFGGYVMSLREEMRLPPELNDNGVQIDSDLVMGVKRVEDLETASFFNHSCEPNAGIKGQIVLVAMRDIEPGEEVTFDYAMVLSTPKGSPQYNLRCNCGGGCRGVVTSEDWRNPALQQKYRGYFSSYLEERIREQENE